MQFVNSFNSETLFSLLLTDDNEFYSYLQKYYLIQHLSYSQEEIKQLTQQEQKYLHNIIEASSPFAIEDYMKWVENVIQKEDEARRFLALENISKVFLKHKNKYELSTSCYYIGQYAFMSQDAFEIIAAMYEMYENTGSIALMSLYFERRHQFSKANRLFVELKEIKGSIASVKDVYEAFIKRMIRRINRAVNTSEISNFAISTFIQHRIDDYNKENEFIIGKRRKHCSRLCDFRIVDYESFKWELNGCKPNDVSVTLDSGKSIMRVYTILDEYLTEVDSDYSRREIKYIDALFEEEGKKPLSFMNPNRVDEIARMKERRMSFTVTKARDREIKAMFDNYIDYMTQRMIANEAEINSRMNCRGNFTIENISFSLYYKEKRFKYLRKSEIVFSIYPGGRQKEQIHSGGNEDINKYLPPIDASKTKQSKHNSKQTNRSLLAKKSRQSRSVQQKALPLEAKHMNRNKRKSTSANCNKIKTLKT